MDGRMDGRGSKVSFKTLHTFLVYRYSIDLKKSILEAYLKEKKTVFFQFYTESESMLKQSR